MGCKKVVIIMTISVVIGLTGYYGDQLLPKNLHGVAFFTLSVLCGCMVSFLCIKKDCAQAKDQEIIRNLRSSLAVQDAHQCDIYFSRSPVGVVVLDENLCFRTLNAKAEEIFGYAGDAVRGKHVSIIVPKEHREKIAHVAQEFSHDVPAKQRSIVFKQVMSTGAYIYCEWFVTPMKEQDGSITAYYALVQDVTERHRAELALRSSQEKLHNILQSIRDFVYVIGLDGIVTFANEAAYNAIGVPKEKWGKVHFADILRLDEQSIAIERLRSGIKNQKSLVPYIYHLQKMDGSGEIPVEVVAMPYFENGVEKFLGVARPIEERLQLEAERTRVDRMHLIGVMAGGIAHDFNNLLTAILGFASLLRANNGQNMDQFLDHIIAAARQATGLTQQLLAFTKGGASIKEVGSIAQVIKRTEKIALGTYSACSCKLVLPDDLWPCYFDHDQVCRVIQNLLINACQSMPCGGEIRIEAENIRLENGNDFALDAGSYVHISVKDHGIGIPVEHLSRIFDPYFTTKAAGEGSGLGLAVAFATVKNHRGYIGVESKEGIGTTFHVYLPADVALPKRHTDHVSSQQIQNQQLHVLIVDDMQLNRDLISGMLEKIGHSYSAVENGHVGLQVYVEAQKSGRPFDLVITDLTIPGSMGGVELSEKLSDLNPGVKVIAISGYAEDLSGNFAAFLSKPFSVEQLQAVMHKIMR